MLCALTRWLISRAEDRGGKPPRFAERHAAGCGACREYGLFAASLRGRLSAEKTAFLSGTPEFSVDFSGTEAGAVERGARVTGRSRSLWRPVPAAAAVLAVVAGALILTRVVPREPALTVTDRDAAFAALRSVTSAPNELQGAVAQAESPLDRERQILERSFLSAVDYLQARLNIKVERKNAPKSL